MRVLIIDDDPALNRLAAFALRGRGMSVVTTTSAGEGLRLAATEAFDVLLVDMVMPELDGMAVVRELRANEPTRRLPVILMSANDQAARDAARRTINVRGVIRKPFDPAKLTDDFLGLLERQGVAQQGEEVPREMRRDFLIAATDRAHAIARGLDALQRHPVATEPLREVATELHRLAGTAGSYGLASVSVAARRGEALCAQTESIVSAKSLGGLRQALDEIRAGLTAAGAEIGEPAGRRMLRVFALRANRAIESAMRLLGADGSFAVEFGAAMPLSHRTDVIVLPADEEGLATIDALRAEPRGRRTAVVVWCRRPDDIRRVSAAEGDEWIADPGDPLRVIGAIRAVAERRFAPAPRVLCVSLDHARSFASVIESAGYAVCIAETADASELALETFEPDLVLAGADREASVRVARRLRLLPPAMSAPLVLVAPRTHADPARLVAATRARALLQLPIPRGLMLATIANFIDSARTQRFALCRDPLTGGLRDAYFRERLQNRLVSTRAGPHLSLALIETEGSTDRLVSTASLLRQRLRETDEIARVGEMRLAVLMEGVEADAAKALLARILDPVCRAVTLDRRSHGSAAEWLNAAAEAMRPNRTAGATLGRAATADR